MRPLPPWAAAIASLAVLSAPRLARADSVAVVLAGPDTADASNEVVNRVRGELVADGFHVATVLHASAVEREAAVREKGRELGSAVAVGLFVGEDSSTIDVYLLDMTSGRTATTHMEGGPAGEVPEFIARHAVEFLRSSLLDFAIAGLRAPTPGPPSAADVADRPVREAAHGRWALEGGVGGLAGFAGVGLSVVPVLRIRLAPTRQFQLRLTGAGLGSNPTVHTGRGSAEVQQDEVVAEAAAVLGQSRWFRPIVVVGAGAFYLGVTGTGVAPYQSQTGHALALAIDGAAGIASSVAPTIDLSLEVHVILTEPGIAVRLVDDDAAHIGRPSLLVTLTMAEWI